MPNPFRFSRRAIKDIDGIWRYVAAHDGVVRAEHVVDEIEAGIRRATELPGAGHKHSDLPERYDAYGVFSFPIVFRIERDVLIVLRVVDG